MTARVAAVAAGPGHHFSKPVQAIIRLVAGLGVEGDGHAGVTVQHRSRVARDPSQPNLRQVHLIHGELFDDPTVQGFALQPGDLGENILTRGIDLLGLATGTRLHVGAQAVIEVTGLRNPCAQIEAFRPGLLAAVLDRAADGSLIRKAGVMAVVIQGGDIRPGDAIGIVAPDGAFRPLLPV